MVRVEAILGEEKLDAVIERLRMIGVQGLTLFPVRESALGGFDLVPKILIEWYGSTDRAGSVVRAIERAAETGGRGDGRICVQSVEEAMRIRTGERGPAVA